MAKETLLNSKIEIKIVGKPAEHASSTTFTDKAKVITPIKAKTKLFSVVNLRILVNNFFFF